MEEIIGPPEEVFVCRLGSGSFEKQNREAHRCDVDASLTADMEQARDYHEEQATPKQTLESTPGRHDQSTPRYKSSPHSGRGAYSIRTPDSPSTPCYTGCYNPYSNYSPSPKRRKRVAVMGMSIAMDELREQLKESLKPKRGMDGNGDQEDDNVSVDSEAMLERMMNQIRLEIRQSEMMELAVEAERAAEAGKESFTGRACIYGGGSDVELKLLKQKPSGLKRHVSYTDILTKPSLIRRRSNKRRLRVLALRDVSEVIPSFGEFHNHLRTQCARHRVAEETLVFTELDDNGDPPGSSENQPQHISRERNARAGAKFLRDFNIQRWVSDAEAHAALCGGLSETQDPNGLPDIEGGFDAKTLTAQFDHDYLDVDEELDDFSECSGSEVGDLLASQIHTPQTAGSSCSKKRSKIRVPPGLSLPDLGTLSPIWSRENSGVLEAIPPPPLFVAGQGEGIADGGDTTETAPASSSSQSNGSGSRQDNHSVDPSSHIGDGIIIPVALFDTEEGTEDGETESSDDSSAELKARRRLSWAQNFDLPNEVLLWTPKGSIPRCRSDSDFNRLELEGDARQTNEAEFVTPVRLRDIQDKSVPGHPGTGGSSDMRRILAPGSGDGLTDHIILDTLSHDCNHSGYLLRPKELALSETNGDNPMLVRPSPASTELSMSMSAARNDDHMHMLRCDGRAENREAALPAESPQQPMDMNVETKMQRAGHGESIAEKVRDEQRDSSNDCKSQTVRNDASLLSQDQRSHAATGYEMLVRSDAYANDLLGSVHRGGDPLNIQCLEIYPTPDESHFPCEHEGSAFESDTATRRSAARGRRKTIRRVMSWPTMPTTPDASSETPEGCFHAITGNRMKRSYVWQAISPQKHLSPGQSARASFRAAMDMISSLSPRSDRASSGSPEKKSCNINGRRNGLLFVDEQDNADFLSNYLYCSKPIEASSPEDTAKAEWEKFQEGNVPCTDLGVDVLCGFFSSFLGGNNLQLPKKTSGRELLAINEEMTLGMEPESWLDFAIEQLDNVFETLIGSAREHGSDWHTFQAPSLKCKKAASKQKFSVDHSEEMRVKNEDELGGTWQDQSYMRLRRQSEPHPPQQHEWFRSTQQDQAEPACPLPRETNKLFEIRRERFEALSTAQRQEMMGARGLSI